MKKRYYIDGKVYGSEQEIPEEVRLMPVYTEFKLEQWKQSLTELACDPSELEKIKAEKQMLILRNEPIDVTEITEVNGEKVYFKEVESESQDVLFNSLIDLLMRSDSKNQKQDIELLKQHFKIARHD